MKKIVRVIGISMIIAGILSGIGYYTLGNRLNSLWFVELVDESIQSALFYLQLSELLNQLTLLFVIVGLAILVIEIGGTYIYKKVKG